MMKWGCLNLKGIICIRTAGSGQGKKKESPSQRALWPPKVLLETSEGTSGQRQQGFSRDGLQAEEQKGWGLDPFFISNQFGSFKSFAAPLPSSVNPRLWSHTFRHSPGLDQAQKELLGVGRRLETTPSPTHPLPLKEKGLKVRAVFLPPHRIHPSTPGHPCSSTSRRWGLSPFNQARSCKLIYKYSLKLVVVALATSSCKVPNHGVS